MWGKYPPNRRFNCDQVPLLFASRVKKTVDFKGTDQVWVSLPDSTLEKKQFSMFLTICADGIYCIDYSLCVNLFLGTSLPAGIIFRGTGTRISTKEKKQYDPRVVVFW